jgi:hypothetical protein
MTKSSSSVAARVTLGTLFLISSIGLFCSIPFVVRTRKILPQVLLAPRLGVPRRLGRGLRQRQAVG